MSATTSILAAAIGSGARTATIVLGKAASLESAIGQEAPAALAALEAQEAPAALAA
jgi:hypothetical protein